MVVLLPTLTQLYGKGGLREWVKKQLQSLGRALANLDWKAAAALPGITSSIVPWLLSPLSNTASWLAKICGLQNLWVCCSWQPVSGCYHNSHITTSPGTSLPTTGAAFSSLWSSVEGDAALTLCVMVSAGSGAAAIPVVTLSCRDGGGSTSPYHLCHSQHLVGNGHIEATGEAQSQGFCADYNQVVVAYHAPDME